MLEKLYKIWMQYEINPRRWTLTNVNFGSKPITCTMRSYPNKEFIRNYNIMVSLISISVAVVFVYALHPLAGIIPIIFGATQNVYGGGSSLTWTDPINAGGAPDGSRARDNSGNDGDVLDVDVFGDQSGLGTFVSARCAINLRDNGLSGDDDQLLFKEDVMGSVTTLRTFTTATDGDYTEDTNIFFNSVEVGSWANLNALSLQAEINQVVDSDNFTWEVDSMFVEVTYTSVAPAGQKAYNFGFTVIALLLKGFKSIRRRR